MESVCHNLNLSLGTDYLAEGVIPSIFRFDAKDTRAFLIDLAGRLLPVFPITSMTKEEIGRFKQKMKEQ